MANFPLKFALLKGKDIEVFMNYPKDFINKIIHGNTLDVLKELPSESVNCVVTSPPYWGLRDYGIEPVMWGGDKNCKHEWVKHIKKPNGGKGSKCANVGANQNDFANMRDHDIESDFCLKCGAWRGKTSMRYF